MLISMHFSEILRTLCQNYYHNSIPLHNGVITKFNDNTSKIILKCIKSNPHFAAKLKVVEFYGWYHWFPI